MTLIDGVQHEVSDEAVVVRFREALTVVSSALVGGGLATARAIINLHVSKNWQPPPRGATSGWEAALADFVARRALPAPYVGLCTSAWTQHAEVAFEEADDLRVLSLVSVGLGNPIAAGTSPVGAGHAPSTINTIVVVDARPSPAALVNLVVTVTEVKTAALREAGLRCPDGRPATGTSTDAVVIAATGRGRPAEFGGPISNLGGLVAHATHRALGNGARAWMARHR
ncbi:MAG: adenosylcobinamide amidohydrolase [Candidatus Rokuibacteriota bacterium]